MRFQPIRLAFPLAVFTLQFRPLSGRIPRIHLLRISRDYAIVQTIQNL
jgi:hypothetical protein